MLNYPQNFAKKTRNTSSRISYPSRRNSTPRKRKPQKVTMERLKTARKMKILRKMAKTLKKTTMTRN